MKFTPIVVPTLFMLFCCSPSASAVSFDCTKAYSDAERLICSDSGLSVLDDALSAANKLSYENAKDKAASKKKAIQEWKSRERDCHDKECLTNWYQRRLSEVGHSEKTVGTGLAEPSKISAGSSVATLVVDTTTSPSITSRWAQLEQIDLRLSDEEAFRLSSKTFPKCRNVTFAGPMAGTFEEMHVLAEMNKEWGKGDPTKKIYKQVEDAINIGLTCRRDTMGFSGCTGMGYSESNEGELYAPRLWQYKKYGELYAKYVKILTPMKFGSQERAVPIFVETRNIRCLGNEKMPGRYSRKVTDLSPMR